MTEALFAKNLKERNIENNIDPVQANKKAIGSMVGELQTKRQETLETTPLKHTPYTFLTEGMAPECNFSEL